MTATVLQLPTARSLATIDVARLTDARSYARGFEYSGQGRVTIRHRTSTSITATVLGTEVYNVRLSIGADGLDSSCSCPVDADDGFCKHLVAVALAATEHASDGAGENVSPASPTDLTRYREAIAARLDAVALEGSRPCCWAEQAHGVIDQVEAILGAGHAAEVIGFCEFAVNCLRANASDIPGPSDDLVMLAVRLGDLHGRARRIVSASAEVAGGDERVERRRTRREVTP